MGPEASQSPKSLQAPFPSVGRAEAGVGVSAGRLVPLLLPTPLLRGGPPPVAVDTVYGSQGPVAATLWVFP